ncbi:MAG: hypothetical protein UT30_C0003G0055 [Candidatus Uhrbacteria bacterium GW2011_GWF2_39_13]|uniref:Uncharacterized protein n=1 Tax=Candidatus Uhrbacteria bacterium GW2011_GWF2_39_13 TaxID=1618995 RepID=A0A0G0MWP6_9BACT|nr:MAG: hypothetical protein UT30_C0003G0055 [Candidatus Uhrbacteria bacterium GW2011_GWF2_39_13]HAU66228.1 hypothetical protein [Candidatus Uhrbacteria bacterium]
MTITRHVFNSGESSWHLLDTPEGERYRLWDSQVAKYISNPLTRDQMYDWFLFDKIMSTLNKNLTPEEVFVRNLTTFGWWEEGEYPFERDDVEQSDDDGDQAYDAWTNKARPEGQLERHLNLDGEFHTQQTEADLCANVALEAIKAYRAYVASSGDPNVLPILSFENGTFSVNMKPRNEL